MIKLEAEEQNFTLMEMIACFIEEYGFSFFMMVYNSD